MLDPVAVPPAAGPLAYIADGGAPGELHWSRALPLHLRAEAAGVRLVPVEIAETEAAHLETDLGDLLAGHGIRLERTATGRWYLASEHPLPDRPPPEALAGRFVEAAIPRRAGALNWAAVLSEIELTLYEHPVNRDREYRGEPPVNALWTWGCGRQPEPPEPFAWGRVLSDDPAWQGWARLAGAEAGELENATPLRPSCCTLVAVHWAEAALAVDDGPGWIDAVSAIERAFVAPAIIGLRDGVEGQRWDRLELCTAQPDHKGRVLSRKALWRFWRRRRPFHNYVASGERG